MSIRQPGPAPRPTRARPFSGLIRRLARWIDRPSYGPLLALLAASDLFVFFWPIEAILVSSVWLRRRRALGLATWVSVGSCLGALALAALVQSHGLEWIERLAPQLLASDAWQRADRWIHAYGAWALWAFAIGPFPQAPGVIVIAAAGVPLPELIAPLVLGRFPKFLFFAWLAASGRRYLSRRWVRWWFGMARPPHPPRPPDGRS